MYPIGGAPRRSNLEVIVFRIAAWYCTGDLSIEHIERARKEIPDGIRDTMCFVGAGGSMVQLSIWIIRR